MNALTTEVLTHVDDDANGDPLSFIWRGQRRYVRRVIARGQEAVGRHLRTFRVDIDGGVFDIYQDPQSGRWHWCVLGEEA